MTFGMNVRFSIEKFVEDALGENASVRISRPLGSFQIVYNGKVFHFYKFGSSHADNVDSLEFDDSETKINIVGDNQQPLPGIMADLRHIVIAHSGNPDDGLLSVYVGAPNGLGKDGSPWAWRHNIFEDVRVAERVEREASEVNNSPSFLDQPETPIQVKPKKRSRRAGENPDGVVSP